MKVAFAVFVKTPGMSPIKTRLAASIGSAAALEFYVRSLNLTQKTVAQLQETNPHIQPFWSLAEKQALGGLFWKQWPQIWQGEGHLGERIARVYAELKKSHEVVALYGADSPHIPAERLYQGLSLLLEGKVTTVVGPTEDGGFYFFASRLNVNPEVWTRVPYSTDHTLAYLKSVWPGEITEIEKDFDVDTLEDYRRVSPLLELFR